MDIGSSQWDTSDAMDPGPSGLFTIWVIVRPDYIVGPFTSENDAKDYVLASFGNSVTRMYEDTTWSIKPMISP